MARGRIVIIGAGMVGLATARALRSRFPGVPIVVLEKEGGVGRHQSGHNSGVVHSGIYYRPGSLKARLCVDGRRRLLEYIAAHGLPMERCGKLIVATEPADEPRLEELARRAVANGVEGVERLDREGIRRREPEATGRSALWVPGTAITEYAAVARSLSEELEADGVDLRLGHVLLGGRPSPDGIDLDTSRGEVPATFVVNCAGLQSDRVAAAFGLDPGLRIVPYRGEYYHLRRAIADRLRALVYPVPDPAFPFLGVHLTRLVHGGVEAGPNAVLAFAREGYHRTAFDRRDTGELLIFPGTYRVLRRHYRMAAAEAYRSFDRHRFAADLARLVPAIRPDDLTPGGAGVRAQAVSRDGHLLDDFAFVEGPGSLHVLNAPSPAATASLAIGEEIARRVPAL